MAVQYAVAHSASIAGVGAIAGPQWGCADASVSRSINVCMCGGEALKPTIDVARRMAAGGSIDGLSSGRPQALKRSFVFQSPADATVVKQSGQADIDFLSAFIGANPKVDKGNTVDGSDQAGHGILAPADGNDSCRADGHEKTYVRRCGAEDNAGKMFLALFEPGSPFDPEERVNDVPDTEVWAFDQRPHIEAVKAQGSAAAPDGYAFFLPVRSSRRENFDMAAKGRIYVPPSCRGAGISCRVHIALHGCKEAVGDFATRAGYNNWAERYKVIVVFPAIAPGKGLSGEICQTGTWSVAWDYVANGNPNGCWDWWGYLDPFGKSNRYLTKEAPQMQVIERIIAEVTKPR